jgi:hypothetical protein
MRCEGLLDTSRGQCRNNTSEMPIRKGRRRRRLLNAGVGRFPVTVWIAWLATSNEAVAVEF